VLPELESQTRARVASLYTSGLTLTEVAARAGIGVTLLRRLLREARVPFRRRGRPAGVTARDREVAALRATGLTLRQIGAHLGCTPQAVHQTVQRVRERAPSLLQSGEQ